MIITKARPVDVDTIVAWRRERTRWLGEIGSDQWQGYAFDRTAIAGPVAAGQTWMVWEGDRPLGTITLAAATDFEGLWKPDIDSDEPLWRPEDNIQDALYVAKMVTAPEAAGRGIGRELIDWAAGRAFDAGLRWIRGDAWTTNTKLHDYYRGLGFTVVRIVQSRFSGACIQRPAQPYRGALKTEE